MIPIGNAIALAVCGGGDGIAIGGFQFLQWWLSGVQVELKSKERFFCHSSSSSGESEPKPTRCSKEMWEIGGRPTQARKMFSMADR